MLEVNVPLHLDICNETCPDLSKQIHLDVFHESLHMSLIHRYPVKKLNLMQNILNPKEIKKI